MVKKCSVPCQYHKIHNRASSVSSFDAVLFSIIKYDLYVVLLIVLLDTISIFLPNHQIKFGLLTVEVSRRKPSLMICREHRKLLRASLERPGLHVPF
jgi:hypothetical protein